MTVEQGCFIPACCAMCLASTLESSLESIAAVGDRPMRTAILAERQFSIAWGAGRQ